MKVLVCGSRTMPWKFQDLVVATLVSLGCTRVIQGDAKGADTLGRLAAIHLGLELETYPADWEKWGKGAGPIRNQQMLDEGKPDLVLAFHPESGITKGTQDMVQRALKAGIPVKIVTYPD